MQHGSGHRADHTERGEYYHHRAHEHREDKVLVDDLLRPSGKLEGEGYIGQAVVHQRDVGGLDREIGSHGAHRDAYVGVAQDERVVDAVADGYDAPSGLAELLKA